MPLTTSSYDHKTGERWIGALGLYDLRNRFMSPELGRFLQADPIGFKGDASNLYRYCGNDSVNRVDPTGLVHLLATLSNRLAWFAGGSTFTSREYDLLKQGQAYIAPPTGNYKDTKVENHVDDSKVSSRRGGVTIYTVSNVKENDDGKLIIRPTLDWYVRDKYKYTDVVKRELEHVSRYLYWQSKDGDGAAAVRTFNRNPTGKTDLAVKMENARFSESIWHDINIHAGGRHDLERNPEKEMNSATIEDLIKNVRPLEMPHLGN